MPKDEWGVKRICPTCSTRFYDLRTDPMTCPNCGATFTAREPDRRQGQGDPAREGQAGAVDIEDLPEIEADEDPIETDDDLDDEILEDEEDNVDLDEIADVALRRGRELIRRAPAFCP